MSWCYLLISCWVDVDYIFIIFWLDVRYRFEKTKVAQKIKNGCQDVPTPNFKFHSYRNFTWHWLWWHPDLMFGWDTRTPKHLLCIVVGTTSMASCEWYLIFLLKNIWAMMSWSYLCSYFHWFLVPLLVVLVWWMVVRTIQTLLASAHIEWQKYSFRHTICDGPHWISTANVSYPLSFTMLLNYSLIWNAHV